jgi:hypothetical protein
MSFDCRTATRRSSHCAVNVPAGNGWSNSNAYFKIQAQASGSTAWCDLTLAINGANGTVFSRLDVNQYLTSNSLSTAGSWCGSQRPNPPWVTGDYVFTVDQYSLLNDRISFGIPQSSSCPGTIGAGAVTNDTGFATMASRAASSATANDYDNDGVSDLTDRCTANRNANQADSNSNGIGDSCEATCYIPASDPNAYWYDFDGDGVDDYCDNNWTAYNPSQY